MDKAAGTRQKSDRPRFAGSLGYSALTGLVVVLLATPYYYLAILVPLLIAGGVLLLFWPELGFLLVIAAEPFSEYTSLSDRYDFLTVTKFVGIATVLVIALRTAVTRFNLVKKLGSPLWAWLAPFFLAVVISTLWSDFPLPSWDFVRKLFTDYIIFSMTLLFVTAAFFHRRLPATIIVCTAASSLLSIAGMAFNIPWFVMDMQSKQLMRAQGAAYDPNYFAMMLTFSLPLLAHFIFFVKKPATRLVCILCLAINLLGIVLTYSRGGALVCGAVMLLTFAAYLPRLKPGLIGFLLMGTLLAITAALAVIPESYWERQKSVTQVATDRALGRRLSYYTVAWNAFVEAPIFGHGPDAFRHLFERSHYASAFHREGVSDKRAAHNAYLEILVGTGLVGLTLFTGLVLAAYRLFFKAMRKFRENGLEESASMVKAYMLSHTAMLLALGMLSAQHHKYFWLALGLSSVSMRLASASKQ